MLLVLMGMATSAWAADITWGTTWYVNHAVGTDNATCGTDATTGACAHLNYIFATRTWTNSGSGQVTIICAGNSADTTESVVLSKTGESATNKIVIQSASSHGGKWNTGIWRLEVTGGSSSALDIRSNYFTIDGLQVRNVSPTQAAQHVITYANGTFGAGANQCYLLNTIIQGHGSGTYTQYGVDSSVTNLNLAVWNCIVYNIGLITDTSSRAFNAGGASQNIYNVTTIGGDYGIVNAGGGTVTLKNVYAGGCGAAGCLMYHSSKTTCATSDTTGDITGVLVSTTADSTHAGFTNITETTEDFHIKVGSPLINTGTDLSATFTTDIDGSTRPTGANTWDIGADEYIVGDIVRRLLMLLGVGP